MAILLSLRRRQTPGLDIITTEMLRADTSTANVVLIPLLEKICKTVELPNDWNKGLLITVRRGMTSVTTITGEKSHCSVPSTILCKVLLDRLTVEPLIRRE